ncbi:MAG TPA: hypothetical protein VFR25_10760 [Candidatus Eisenbacteria bacterium]|nr:hypothetical protein [Candidatus Eisenbacteria bacterium]
MRAYRSSARTRVAPHSLSLLPWLLLLTGLVLAAGRAGGATPTPPKPATPPDTTGGFRVRVSEEGDASSLKIRRQEERIRREVERAKREAARIKADLPKPPDVPDAPDIPDVNIDLDSNDNNLVRFGEDIVIPADKVIDGDVVAIGGDVTVYGRVKGDCVSVGGTVNVKDKGVVEGDAVSMGGGVATSDSASVGGSNVSLGSPWTHSHAFWPMVGLFGAVGTGIWLVHTLVRLALTVFLAWLALLLARERMVYAVDTMYARFGRSFLWGLAGFAGSLVALPTAIVLLILVGAIAIAILAITIIGIPVAIVLLLGLILGIIGLVLGVVVAVFLGFLNGAMFLGQRVLGRTTERGKNPLLAIAVGVLLITTLKVAGKLIGVLGLIVFHPIAIALAIATGALAAILTIAGFGAMMQTRFARGPHGEGLPTGMWWPRRRPSPAAAPAGAPGVVSEAPITGAASVATPPPPPASPPIVEGGTSDAP